MKLQQNPFSILQIGDRQIERLRKKVCMIVGLTKNGKSCFFNHLLGKAMVGAEDPQDPQRVIYVPKASSNSVLANYAVMGSSPVSVTLAPNIADFNDFSLVDMIGFQQNRNENSILAVSYFLSSCFERAHTLLFTVVIAAENLMCKNMELICGSFNELIETFALRKFSTTIRQNFMNSISIVVSSADRNLEYYRTRIGTIIKQLKNPQLQTIRNRELIVQVLESVCGNNRVECFEQAKFNEANPKCTTFQQLAKAGWREFDLKMARQAMKEELIVIPFKQDLNKLDQAAIQRLKDRLNTKIENLYEIASIFEIYLSALRDNWMEGKYRQLDLIQVHYSLRRCLKPQMRYTDALRARNIIIPANQNLNPFTVLTGSIEIYELYSQLEQQCQKFSMEIISFDLSLVVLENIFGKMIDCMVPAFTQRADLQALTELKFILGRCFKQFKKFNELDPGTNSSSLINNKFLMRGMKDKLAFSCNAQEQFTLFMLTLDKNTLGSQFNNLLDLDHYQAILVLYKELSLKNKKIDEWFQIRMVQMKLAAKQLKLEIYKLTNKRLKVIEGRLEIIELLVEEYSLKRNRNLNWADEPKIWDTLKNYKMNRPQRPSSRSMSQSSPQDQLQMLYYQLLSAINNLVDQVKNPSQFGNIMVQVLQLCDLTKSASLAHSIYESRFNSEQNISSRIAILEGHVKLCKRQRWLQRASQLLHTKREYHLQLSQFAKVKEAEAELAALSAAQIKGASNIMVDNSSNSFTDSEIGSLKSILTAIKREVQRKSLLS